MPRIVVSLEGLFAHGQAYVACSRVRNLQDLAVLPTPLALDMLNGDQDAEEVQALRTEVERLTTCSKKCNESSSSASLVADALFW